MALVSYAADGTIWYGEVTPVQLAVPSGLAPQSIRPSALAIQSRVYEVGLHAPGTVVCEDLNIYPLGVQAPTAIPTLATSGAAGSGVVLLPNIVYFTFLHKIGDAIIAESNLGPPSPTVDFGTTAGFSRTTGNIPQLAFDSRVNFIRMYASVSGDIPKMVWERPIGSGASVTDAVPANARGDPAPTSLDSTGNPIVDQYGRGVPPNSLYVELYHNRLFYAGVKDHPDRLYKSRLFEYEAVNSNDAIGDWMFTLDHEPITGIKRHGDYLIVGCPRSMYAVQEFAAGDFQMQRISDSYGVISHHSMQRIGPQADLWFASQEGVTLYNGGFRYIMEDKRSFWRDDYRNNQSNYESSFAVEDRFQQGYLLVIPQPVGQTNQYFAYYAHHMPTQYGNQPYWFFDRMTRQVTGAAVVPQQGQVWTEVYLGCADGLIRKANVKTDAGDDGDTLLKAGYVTTKHFFFYDQGGDDQHASSIKAVDLFLSNETTPVTLQLYGGDDSAATAISPSQSYTIPAGAVTSPRSKVARTSYHQQVEEVSGKGVALKISWNSSTDVDLRGLAIQFDKGLQDRLYTS
jgi:hypothetical protein